MPYEVKSKMLKADMRKSFYNIIHPNYFLVYEIRSIGGYLIGYYYALNDTFVSPDRTQECGMIDFIYINQLFYKACNGYIFAVPVKIIKIQRAWRKWFLRKQREKLDPIKKELMAWMYHPSRLTFNVE